MKKIIFSLFIAMFILSLQSCIKEGIVVSGDVIEEEFQVSEFTGIDVSHSFQVYLDFGNEESIVVEADDNVIDHVEVFKNGNDLRVKLDPFINLKGNSTLNIYITTRQLNEIKASGATTIFLNEEMEENFVEIKLSGASEITGAINCDRIKLDASGASNADLFGNCRIMEAELSGASELKNFDLSVDDLTLDASSSRTKLTVNNTIWTELSGGSSLEYKGQAEIIHQRLTGGSNITDRN